MEGPFQTHQGNVVVMKIGEFDAVVAIATTNEVANEIVEGLNTKYLEKVMAGDTTTATENLSARVQEARRILATGDEEQMLAYLLGVTVEDVRRVSGATHPPG